MRFLLDENLHPAAASLLKEQGHDALHVREARLLGQPDRRLIEFANQEDRLFVTLDLDLAISAGEIKTGLILIRLPRRLASRNLPSLLADALSKLSQADLSGKITVIAPGSIRSRPLS